LLWLIPIFKRAFVFVVVVVVVVFVVFFVVVFVVVFVFVFVAVFIVAVVVVATKGASTSLTLRNAAVPLRSTSACHSRLARASRLSLV
jgi:hypothetical protein